MEQTRAAALIDDLYRLHRELHTAWEEAYALRDSGEIRPEITKLLSMASDNVGLGIDLLCEKERPHVYGLR